MSEIINTSIKTTLLLAVLLCAAIWYWDDFIALSILSGVLWGCANLFFVKLLIQQWLQRTVNS